MRAGKLLIASLTGVLIIVGGILLILRTPSSSPLSGGEISSSPLPSLDKGRLGGVSGETVCPDFQEGEVTVGEVELTVSLANTQAEKTKGLSGCSELPEKAGMLFPYKPAKTVTFWMKNMVMPIDIVWIHEGRVIGIEPNIPAPTPGVPEKELPQYASPGSVDAVLEIKAGGAEEYGIVQGTEISWNN
ncbi:MAG: DUF192 domain-containing protein [Patescibacteria group bacterium]